MVLSKYDSEQTKGSLLKILITVRMRFHPGQRWISESEPELGLGSILTCTDRTVTVRFAAAGENRNYALENPPLRRVSFRAGDVIKSREKVALKVEAVSERNGLLVYQGAGREISETELSDSISFDRPEQRLRNGQIDPPEMFDLRFSALTRQHLRRKSKVRGFIGGRIQLIPHQLYIATEVTHRLAPRVLLADEVGLGKTIEACLILHRLIQTGRAQRALVLVPEPLIHQWFVELLRRFNLWFHIFDEERCESIEASDPEANPFLEDQLVLSSIAWLSGNELRAKQAIDAGWDILVVDEAHHLGWSPELVNPGYSLIERLARVVPGLLLLTATPEQLGLASHFARLRLLDPDRYYDLDEFKKEAEQYRDVARIAIRLIENAPLADNDREMLAQILHEDEPILRSKLQKMSQGDAAAREELIEDLLDQHGTGRVMFRNTRATMTGFPKRQARVQILDAPADPALLDRLAEEFAADTDSDPSRAFNPNFAGDPRIPWLADLLRNLGEAKALLICRSLAKAEAVDAALRERINVKTALFHEGLPLVQRDRNAAWFAEPDGARLLISSEIGSEGRNFQFAHHLVLFDLPSDPELLEQRIGRLDRIGQKAEIQIHVPFVRGSAQEVLARWYQEGLNAFETNLHGARELLERFGDPVHDLAQDFHETRDSRSADLDLLVEETCEAAKEIATRLEEGRDRLLELNSFRPKPAARLTDDMRRADADTSLDAFMLTIFDHYSIHLEELGQRTYNLGSAGVFADLFPGLPVDGLTVTADRQQALAREDIQFLTWDHPLVTGALDLLLGSEIGKSSFAVWLDPKVRGLYLETIFLIESIAPSELHLDRFLPPTPLRIVVDHRGEEITLSMSAAVMKGKLRKGDAHLLLDEPSFRDELLPRMVEAAQALAEREVPAIVALARGEMNTQLRHEISRLRELQRVNRNVRADEIESLNEQQHLMDEHLASARVRLDSIRLIQRGPA